MTAQAAARSAAQVTTDGSAIQCLCFTQMDGAETAQAYAIDMDEVREIMRVPEFNAVPLAGAHLLGVTNLRGAVLPIASLNRLLGLQPTDTLKTSRVLVLKGDYPVGILVDRVEQVEWVPAHQLDRSERSRAHAQHGLLAGFVRPDSADQPVRRLLNGAAVMAASSARDCPATASNGPATGTGTRHQNGRATIEEQEQFISFELGSQRYALSIRQIKEVVRPPAELDPLPGAAEHIVGIMPLRELMVPLISLTRLYQLKAEQNHRETRVLVVPVGARDGREFIGLVVDRLRQVVTVKRSELQPVPESLTAEGDFNDISALIETAAGGDLTAVLDARKLLNLEALRDAARATDSTEAVMTQTTEVGEERQWVVFNLQDEEYGVAIESAKEIVRLPEKLTRVPQAEDFIEGVINLRGQVLPVIDLRRRFGLEVPQQNHRQRIIVLNLNGQRTGFIVDEVREVRKVAETAIEAAPPLSPEQATLVTEVANLTEEDRLILLLNTQRLVSEQEARRLAQLQADPA